MKTSYDRATDSLYLELRPLPAVRTVEVEEDVMLDLGEDGEPVGYDVQHASHLGFAEAVPPRWVGSGWL